ncbi:MAG: hypothetical protein NT062_33405 [Proteobacteria bacterium]|nr:hypothetical protein [Pseudomonadota bacterium]
MVRVAALMVALVACQGSGASSDPATVGSGSAPASQDAVVVAADAGVADKVDEPAPRKPSDEPEPVVDPGKLVADLGAIPAWQAAVDRYLYLERRKQRGIVYGTLGPAVMMPAPTPPPGIDAGVGAVALVASPYVWLVDDSEGHGALGIRVKLGPETANAGERVALAGAWDLDDARRWFWRATTLTKLPALDPAKELKDPRPVTPAHTIATGELPAGARTVSLARDNDAIYFQIVGPAPTTDGDGWAIADELGNPTAAMLNLPGERASYGRQDMRTLDERWSLRRGVTYWLRIGKVRRKAPDKPMSLNARTAPIRVL